MVRTYYSIIILCYKCSVRCCNLALDRSFLVVSPALRGILLGECSIIHAADWVRSQVLASTHKIDCTNVWRPTLLGIEITANLIRVCLRSVYPVAMNRRRYRSFCHMVYDQNNHQPERQDIVRIHIGIKNCNSVKHPSRRCRVLRIKIHAQERHRKAVLADIGLQWFKKQTL